MEAVERHRAAADRADVGGAAGCLEPRFAVGDVLVSHVRCRGRISAAGRRSVPAAGLEEYKGTGKGYNLNRNYKTECHFHNWSEMANAICCLNEALENE